MSFTGYKVIDTEMGLMISESRTSIYDVLLTQLEGEDFDSICVIHNLRPLQVQVALEYIDKHRAELEADLPALLAKKAEYERHHRAIAAEREKAIGQLPMTPQRAAFYALRQKNQQLGIANGESKHSK
ncbi:MAG TPA: hypothetical protein P5121_38325 [Caldilineaceae bacterium]|nr:hypothetical protein [Caldilineaceae bacterium]